MNPPESPAYPGPSPADDARIEKMLRESSQTYINDDGFTGRILGALPPPRRRAERRRQILLFGAALLGTGGVAVVSGADLGAFSARVMGWLADWSALPVPGFGAAFTVGVLGCWVLTLAAGWWAWARRR